MMAKWYYRKGTATHGPIDSASLQHLARIGDLAPDDLVRRDDMRSWAKASKVQGLFSPAPNASAPHSSKSVPPQIGDVPVASAAGKSVAAPKSSKRNWRTIGLLAAGSLVTVIVLIGAMTNDKATEQVVADVRESTASSNTVAAEAPESPVARADAPTLAKHSKDAPDVPNLDGSLQPIRHVAKPVATLDAKYAVSRLSFTKNGEYLVVHDKQIWHVPTRQLVTLNPTPLSVSVSHDGLKCAGISLTPNQQPEVVTLFSLNGSKATTIRTLQLNEFNAFDSSTPQLRWSPDGSSLVAVMEWQIRLVTGIPTAPTVRTIRQPDYDRLAQRDSGAGSIAGRCIAFSPDSRNLALGFDRPRGVTVYDVPTGSVIQSLKPDDADVSWDQTPLSGFSPDGEWIVTSHDQRGQSGVYQFWNTKTWIADQAMAKQGRFAGFLGDGSTLALVAHSPGALDVWTTNPLTQSYSVQSGLLPNGFDAHFDATGQIAVVRANEAAIQVWDIKRQKLLAHIGPLDEGTSSWSGALSSDGRLFATGYKDGTVAIWELENGSSLELSEYARHVAKMHSGSSVTQRLAPPVTRDLFDQISEGMDQREVWRLLGGRCHESKSALHRPEVFTKGGAVAGNDLIYEVTEYYVGVGGGRSGVVLLYQGRGSSPTLVRKFAVGLP